MGSVAGEVVGLTAPAAGGTTEGMPPTKKPAHMTPDQLRALIARSKYAKATKSAVARAIGVARSHLYRWLDGDTNISEANALLIKTKLKPRQG